MTYRQSFAQQCREDGLDLGVANALRRLRAGASVNGGGWQRLLERTIAWNKSRVEAQQHIERSNQKKGRAA